VFGSASAPPFGLRSSRTEHLHHQRPRGWAKTNRRSGPSQVAKLTGRSIAWWQAVKFSGKSPSRSCGLEGLSSPTTTLVAEAELDVSESTSSIKEVMVGSASHPS